MRNDSIPTGKKENSIRKPLPNSIRTNIIDVAKNIVVKASMSKEIVIYGSKEEAMRDKYGEEEVLRVNQLPKDKQQEVINQIK